MYDIMIKSGTSGYSDYGNCDKQIAKIPSNNIPNVGDILQIDKKYLVREIKRSLVLPTKRYEFGEYIYVYVIEI
jgi:hypothetical protein